MSPKILHLFGPFSLHLYGIFIALGTCIGFFLLNKDTKLKLLISEEQLSSLVTYTIIAGIIGGRLLFTLENWSDWQPWWTLFEIWKPGYSILGSVAAGVSCIYFYLKRTHIIAIKVMDRIALYVPLVQSIARIGCYLTGCCYGTITTLPWAVIYTDQNHLAPLCTPLHPTQLYSSLLLLALFVLLFFIQEDYQKDGQLLGLYLIGASLERFTIDFLRADRTLVVGALSATQLLAITILCFGTFVFYKLSYAKRKQQPF